jgi:hypothetical protein
MTDGVRRLAREDEPAIDHLLASDPVVNLFLIGFLSLHSADRTWWYGVGDPVRAVVLVLPGRLAVPYASNPAEAELRGDHRCHQHAPCLLVGPRATSDALWERWAPRSTPRRRYDQRLYRLESAPPGEDPPGFRLGTVADAPQVVPQAAAMELEDLGVDPASENRTQHEAAVLERLKGGRTWVRATGRGARSAAPTSRRRTAVRASRREGSPRPAGTCCRPTPGSRCTSTRRTCRRCAPTSVPGSSGTRRSA